MAVTGYKQATVAYKVSRPGGEPLDVNGILTRMSGRKQAIAVLEGYPNPDPIKYEVEAYFNKQGQITGNSTIDYNILSCPIGFIRITPSVIVLQPSDPVKSVTLECNSNWQLINSPGIATPNYTSGGAGQYIIDFTQTEEVGQGVFIFRNNLTLQTVSLTVANVLSAEWVLEDNTWNPLGIWYDNGIWKY